MTHVHHCPTCGVEYDGCNYIVCEKCGNEGRVMEAMVLNIERHAKRMREVFGLPPSEHLPQQVAPADQQDLGGQPPEQPEADPLLPPDGGVR